MNDERQGSSIFSQTYPLGALRAFENLYFAWLDQNQEALEHGGIGNYKDLAEKSWAWAASYFGITNQGPRYLGGDNSREPVLEQDDNSHH